MIVRVSDLSPAEVAALSRCERTIKQTKGAFVACGQALAEIRDLQLYRQKYKTFEQYCETVWGWSRSYAYRLIEGSGIKLSPIGDKIQTESQAREISKVPVAQRDAVIHKALETGKITAKSISAVAKEEKIIELDNLGRPIPEAIVSEWKRAEEVGRRLRSLASEIKLTVERGIKDHDLIFGEITNVSISEAEQLHYALGQLTPHAVCPVCQGHQRARCQLCKKRGFISKWLFKSPALSDEQRKLAAPK